MNACLMHIIVAHSPKGWHLLATGIVESCVAAVAHWIETTACSPKWKLWLLASHGKKVATISSKWHLWLLARKRETPVWVCALSGV